MVNTSFFLKVLKSFFLFPNWKNNCFLFRYIRENDKCLRKKKVPDFMQNFPTKMARKCLEKYKLAMNQFAVDDLKKGERENVFIINSSTSTCRYIVDYNSGTCTCRNFTSLGEPCKHMFVPICLSQATWEDMTPILRSTPYMTIDHQILKHLNPDYPLETVDGTRLLPEDVDDIVESQSFLLEEKSGASYEVDDHVQSSSASGSFFAKRILSEICEKVENIKSAAHATENVNVLKETLQKLNEIYSVLQNSIPKRCGVNRLKMSPVKVEVNSRRLPRKVRKYLHFSQPLKKPYRRGRPKLKRKDLKKLVKETEAELKAKMNEFRKGTDDEEDVDNVFNVNDSSSCDQEYEDTPLKERLLQKRKRSTEVPKKYTKKKLFSETEALVPDANSLYCCTAEEEAESESNNRRHMESFSEQNVHTTTKSDAVDLDTPLAERLKSRLLIDPPCLDFGNDEEDFEVVINNHCDDGEFTSDEIPQWRDPCTEYHSKTLKKFLKRKDFNITVRDEYLSIFHPEILRTIKVVKQSGWEKKVISPMVSRVTEKSTFDEIVKDYFLRSDKRHTKVKSEDFTFTCTSILVMFELEDKVQKEELGGVCLECPERYCKAGDSKAALEKLCKRKQHKERRATPKKSSSSWKQKLKARLQNEKRDFEVMVKKKGIHQLHVIKYIPPPKFTNITFILYFFRVTQGKTKFREKEENVQFSCLHRSGLSA
jgi:hypothetical protein